MKVLYVAPYRDGTGYGHAAVDTILAMDSVGIEVVPRPLKLNKHITATPERILELEQRSPRGADFVIQHTLPEMMEPSGHFLANIAMYCTETSNFNSSTWAHRLNSMDVAWVPSEQMIEAARASNVKIPIKKIPYPCDLAKFERSYKPLKLAGTEDTFVFYTISEMGKRKNMKALLQAFHTEFEPHEPVSLVIKTHKYGMDADTCRKHVEADCDSIKQWLKLYPNTEYFKKEVIISDVVDDESLMKLHSTCDCFVLTSHGEAWSIPAFEAMAFGKTPIVPNWGGFREYVTNDTGWLVDCHEEQVFGITDSFGDLYTGKESWAAVSIGHLRKCMREAYANQTLRGQKADLGIEHAYEYSYHLVGSLIKKALENYEQEKRNTA